MTYFGYLYLYTDRTGEKIVHYTSLILNEFACGEVHTPCLCNQQTNIEVFCVYAL